MSPALAAQLPLLPLTEHEWFRSVDERFQFEPPLIGSAPSRFNPGDLRVMYFAPNPLLARFEARDLLGQWSGNAVPAPQARHVVVEYHVDIGPAPAVADLRVPQFATVETTMQEMTGDWLTYPWEAPKAPTQDLAGAVYRMHDTAVGLIAPSARNPEQANLVLFADRLPTQSISIRQIHLWHPSQLEARSGGGVRPS